MAGNQAFFANKPNINIGRTRWNMTFDHPTAWQHGKVIPIACIPMLPGDSINMCKVSSLIRMNQPIVPIMDNIRASLYAVWIPQRLVHKNCKKFYGENEETAGPQLTNYKIPSMGFGTRACEAGSISNYLHKPIVKVGTEWTDALEVSVLKERCYYLAWNNLFRAQQFTAPVSINLNDYSGNEVGNYDFGICNKVSGHTYTQNFFGDYVGQWNSKPLPCGKQFDYFTSATLQPQYGPTIDIPLGDYAPLGVLYDEDGTALSYTPKAYDSNIKEWINAKGNSVYFGYSGASVDPAEFAFLGNNDHTGQLEVHYADESIFPGDGFPDDEFKTNLIVDLSNATAASINTLRAAFAAQRFYERSIYGSRYYEYLQVHYSVNPPLGLLDYPELLGEHHWNINIQQVLSTAGAADDDSTKLGQPGANSTTGDSARLFKKSFVEHGFLMILLTTTHDRHYTQGFLREDLKREMLEIYHPEFATLGDQAIYRNEIFAKDGQSNDVTFGYQEHWAEYRYRPSRATSVLDPQSSSGMSMWTLTESLADPQLGNNFIYETREALASSLVTGVESPFDYIGDFYFDIDIIRPMPLYSVPGRIDHVGGW